MPEVKEMLKNASLSATCSKHAGWLKKEFIEDIRNVMYEYLERAWQKYLAGNLPSCGNEHINLYSNYMEEDNLDYTRQQIMRRLEEVIDEDKKNEDEYNECSSEIEVAKDEYLDWSTNLDREELAKIIFSDNHIKTEVINSNPCSDEEDDVDLKMDNMEI